LAFGFWLLAFGCWLLALGLWVGIEGEIFLKFDLLNLAN
jgi:hypothetical protein